MAKTSGSRPTGKSGRGVMPRSNCCVCSGTKKLRLNNGEIKGCTNCNGTGKQ